MANCQNNMRYGRQMNFNSGYNSTSGGNSNNCGCRNMPINSNNERRTMPSCGNQTDCPASMQKGDYQHRTSEPCQCRYDVLADFPLAMAYVPWQKWQDVFESCKALQCGTIFEELWKPFHGKGGCNR